MKRKSIEFDGDSDEPAKSKKTNEMIIETIETNVTWATFRNTVNELAEMTGKIADL